MALKNIPDHISHPEINGSTEIVEWRRRRGALEADVYVDSALVVTVAYKQTPKLSPDSLDELAVLTAEFGLEQRVSMEKEEKVLI